MPAVIGLPAMTFRAPRNERGSASTSEKAREGRAVRERQSIRPSAIGPSHIGIVGECDECRIGRAHGLRYRRADLDLDRVFTVDLFEAPFVDLARLAVERDLATLQRDHPR